MPQASGTAALKTQPPQTRKPRIRQVPRSWIDMAMAAREGLKRASPVLAGLQTTRLRSQALGPVHRRFVGRAKAGRRDESTPNSQGRHRVRFGQIQDYRVQSNQPVASAGHARDEQDGCIRPNSTVWWKSLLSRARMLSGHEPDTDGSPFPSV